VGRTRLVRLGALAWIIGVVQFFVVHLAVQSGWKTPPYSWAANNISDLGNIHCGPWGDDRRYVCSPLHDWMNVSFVTGGVLILAGVLLTTTAWPRTVLSWFVRLLLLATGGGWLVAGLAPADVNENLHVVGGAFVIFTCGNLAMLLGGLLRPPAPIARTRWYAAAFGAAGLIAMVLFFGGHDLGLGPGGMERVTAYGVPVWTLITGITLLRTVTSDRQQPGTSLPGRSRRRPAGSAAAPSRDAR
jgi:hypothetical membrane protein